LPAGGVGAPAGGVGAPEAETKEYHFQVAGQTSADFAATQVLQPGQTRLLPLSWRTTGIAVSLKAPLRQAAVSLKEASVPAEPQASGSSAPGHP
jgi:hypothetical protein